MVRLPQAISPSFQKIFREIRELLPTLFSHDEQKRYIKDFYSLKRTGMYEAFFKGGSGAPCRFSGCTGVPHNSSEYYEELAEVIIGRIFTWAHKPEDVQQSLVQLLKEIEHNAVYRASGKSDPLPIATAAYVRDMAERHDRQRI